MKTQVVITREPIDETGLLRSRAPSVTAGAVVTFLGVVRGTEAGETISGLEYEAFEEMAQHQFDQALSAMEKRWPIESVRLVHRIGTVRAGEPSLWMEVAAPHRGEALDACEWLIEELKRVVPIWKRAVK